MSDRVLVVDDEPMVLHMIERTLRAQGFPTESAPTAECALAMLNLSDGAEVVVTDAMADPPTMVVSDLKLPGMNGCEFAREVLKRWPATRILFVSGYGAEDLVRKGMCPRGLPLLAKPFGPDGLMAAVHDTLARPPWHPPEWRAP